MRKLKEQILLRIIFPLADFVMGTCAMKWYKQIVYLNSLSADEIQKWQLDQLSRLLNHAYDNTVYYKEVFDSLNLKPSDIKTFEDLKKLPVLTRDIIKERFNDIVPKNIKSIKHRYNHTGGSTGEPMKYICDENTWGFVTAMKIYSWKTTGYRYGDLFMSLGSSSLFPVNKRSLVHEIYFRLRNTIPLNGMNMDDSICDKYVKIAQKHKVKYIYGYATAIYLLALYCKKNNIQLPLKAAFTTAEKLHPHYRQTISDAFGCRVMDCYGSKDGGVTAYEVSPGYYHVGYASYFEIANDFGSLQTLYATNLIDYAFPTIRYANGDEVVMHKPLETEYNGQLMKEVVGRTSDVVELANGNRLTTSGFNSLFRTFNVEAFRIKKVAEDKVLVQIKKRNNYTDSEHDLLFATITKYIGAETKLEFEYVSEFQPLKNGKRSFLMNDLSVE